VIFVSDTQVGRGSVVSNATTLRAAKFGDRILVGVGRGAKFCAPATPPRIEVKERVEIYLYPLSKPSRTGLGLTLPYTIYLLLLCILVFLQHVSASFKPPSGIYIYIYIYIYIVEAAYYDQFGTRAF
jgi:hypothetical protein